MFSQPLFPSMFNKSFIKDKQKTFKDLFKDTSPKRFSVVETKSLSQLFKINKNKNQ